MKLVSKIDESINNIEEHLKGFVESRYVRRVADYFVCYLSSQTGCNRGCRFCHLTATKQTKFDDVNVSEFLDQAVSVFNDYKKSNSPAKYVHYNFMARGEPLNNQIILNDGDYLLNMLGSYASTKGLGSKFNVSTILPRDTNKSLVDIFKFIHPTIYYSVYSNDETWRKKWLPNAMSFDDALRELKEYQDRSKKIIKFHNALIQNENDEPDMWLDILESIKKHNINVEFNIVRYNPYSDLQGTESTKIETIKVLLENHFPTKVITRVGGDVFASCGQFVEKSNE